MQQSDFTVFNILQASSTGNIQYSLKLAIALAAMLNSKVSHEKLMFIWEKTNEKLMLPFAWTWSQYKRIADQSLSSNISLETDEVLGEDIMVAEVVKIVQDIDLMVLVSVHMMVQEAKIELDISALRYDQSKAI